MSAAAEASAKHVIHPKVKGSRRALLNTIATLIPEGQTMTAPIGDKKLAALIGYDRRTTQFAREDLVDLRLMRIVGGGRGRRASYELSSLSGAGATDPVLPLIGRARPATPRLESSDEQPTLFDPSTDVDVAYNMTDDDEFRAYPVRSFYARYRSHVRNVRCFFARWSSNVRCFFARTAAAAEFRAYSVRSFYARTRPAVDVDDARARDVQQLHNNNNAAEPPRRPEPPPLHAWHAWCGGRVHVPKGLHGDFVRLQQRADESIAEVESRLFSFYRQYGSPAVSVTDRDEFVFWRRCYAEEFTAVSRAVDRAPPITNRRPMRPPDIVGGTVCPHTPRCDLTTECIERIVAEGRAARAQQSG